MHRRGMAEFTAVCSYAHSNESTESSHRQILGRTCVATTCTPFPYGILSHRACLLHLMPERSVNDSGGLGYTTPYKSWSAAEIANVVAKLGESELTRPTPPHEVDLKIAY